MHKESVSLDSYEEMAEYYLNYVDKNLIMLTMNGQLPYPCCRMWRAKA